MKEDDLKIKEATIILKKGMRGMLATEILGNEFYKSKMAQMQQRCQV